MDIDGIDISGALPHQPASAIGKIYAHGIRRRALQRAYNNWLHDYCQTDPDRLKGVAFCRSRTSTRPCASCTAP